MPLPHVAGYYYYYYPSLFPGPPRGNWSSPFKFRRISVDSVNTSITIYFTEVVCRSLDRFC